MNIIKSLQKRLIVTLFFIFSFTFAILTFSIGNSAINGQQEKAKKFNKENNNMLTFIDTSGVSIKELVEVLKNESVSIMAIKEDTNSGYQISTILQNEGFKLTEDMKSGEFYSMDYFRGNAVAGLYSNPIENKDIAITSQITGKDIKIKKDGVFFDTNTRLIVTNKAFEELYSLDEPNLSGMSIILSGEKESLDKAVALSEDYVKSKKQSNKLLVFPYLVQDKSLEGEALYSAAILIVLITIINSVSICALWVEGRKKEIILRKTFGATNKDITKIFFAELLVLSIVATLIALLVQAMLQYFTGGYISNISIRLNMNNFIYSIILAIVTAFVSSVPSLIYLQKVQPIEILREE